MTIDELKAIEIERIEQIRADVLKDVLEIVKDLEKRSINNHEWVFKELRKELKSKEATRR